VVAEYGIAHGLSEGFFVNATNDTGILYKLRDHLKDENHQIIQDFRKIIDKYNTWVDGIDVRNREDDDLKSDLSSKIGDLNEKAAEGKRQVHFYSCFF